MRVIRAANEKWTHAVQKAISTLDSMNCLSSEVLKFQLNRGEVVPRDRIELSTPAFSGQEESEQDQTDKGKTQCKK